MTAQKGASAVWRKLLYLCSEKRDHPVHEHEVKHRAHKDEQVKNLVTAKAGIIAARPLDGVEHAAHGVENAAAQHPEKAGRGEQAQQGDEGHHSQPAHEDIDAGGEPAGGGDPGQGEHQPGQGQGPDDTEQGPAPGTVGAEHHQADRGIGTGDEEVDRGVVVLAQGDTALDADVAAVIESAGRIQAHHAHAVDEEGDHVPRAEVLVIGLFAFVMDTIGGVLLAKFMNLFLKKKINPMIGGAGISAFPMSSRVVQKMAMEEDPTNVILMQAAGANVSGQIASVIAGGMVINLVTKFL